MKPGVGFWVQFLLGPWLILSHSSREFSQCISNAAEIERLVMAPIDYVDSTSSRTNDINTSKDPENIH